jgi:SAM-dependent methyltransferase
MSEDTVAGSGGAERAWTTDTITSEVFRNKLVNISDIFAQWVAPLIDIPEATILDFGCGDGAMALGLALNLRPRKVIGVDLNSEHGALGEIARQQIGLEELPANLEFHTLSPGEKLSGRFEADCVFTWSVFEHIYQDYLDDVVSDLKGVVPVGGHVMLQVAPLFYSANGSHLNDVVEEPWAHLLHQHDKLERLVLSAPRPEHTGQIADPADEAASRQFKKTAWDCYLTLNRIIGDDIIEMFERQGFETVREYRTDCEAQPGDHLKRIYSEDILRNEQIVALFRKTA